MSEQEQSLTVAQAYEAAYRFVCQYLEREPNSVSLQLMVVSMEPKDDHYLTNDPASWGDWRKCVDETLRGDPMPHP